MKQRKIRADLAFRELHGPVKELLETTYRVVSRNGVYVPGVLDDNSFGNALMVFSREGIETERRYFTIEGVEYIWRYTPLGDDKEILRFAKDGALTFRNHSIYNEVGDITEMRLEHPLDVKEKLQITKYEYNERGKLASETATIDGVMSRYSTYSYDEARAAAFQMNYDGANALTGKVETIVDAEGKVTERKDYDSEGGLKKCDITHYDENGEYCGTTENGVFTPYIKQESKPPEYEYDHHGNWIRKLSFWQQETDGETTTRPEDIKLREITYWDEPSGERVLSIDDVIYDLATALHPIPPAALTNALTPAQWQWVAEGTDKYRPFSIERYYTAAYGFFPSKVTISSYEVDLWSLERYLIRSFGAAHIFGQSEQMGNMWNEAHEHIVLAFPRNKYMLLADSIQHNGSSNYEYSGKPANDKAKIGDYVQFGDITLYYPGDSFGGRDESFEEELDAVVTSFRVRKKAEKPQISMVTVVGNSFSLQGYPVKDDFEIKDLDLNYGNGFEKFNDGLLGKFNTTTQGLILLHGAPGTGKTFYVRHLLRKLSASSKVVIYMPPNMVDHLVEPSFMTFISSQVNAHKASGKSCVMLIEDAEPLLVARDEHTRIQGITNLLNMTDGLLNDMLGLQIICTFNVPLKQLDKALLRPGRLIARKEFKALPEFEANVLAHSLGIKHVFTKPATLGEIYGKAADKAMLTHDE